MDNLIGYGRVISQNGGPSSYYSLFFDHHNRTIRLSPLPGKEERPRANCDFVILDRQIEFDSGILMASRRSSTELFNASEFGAIAAEAIIMARANSGELLEQNRPVGRAALLRPNL